MIVSGVAAGLLLSAGGIGAILLGGPLDTPKGRLFGMGGVVLIAIGIAAVGLFASID
jgi:hypothetical protein